MDGKGLFSLALAPGSLAQGSTPLTQSLLMLVPESQQLCWLGQWGGGGGKQGDRTFPEAGCSQEPRYLPFPDGFATDSFLPKAAETLAGPCGREGQKGKRHYPEQQAADLGSRESGLLFCTVYLSPSPFCLPTCLFPCVFSLLSCSSSLLLKRRLPAQCHGALAGQDPSVQLLSE